MVEGKDYNINGSDLFGSNENWRKTPTIYKHNNGLLYASIFEDKTNDVLATMSEVEDLMNRADKENIEMRWRFDFYVDGKRYREEKSNGKIALVKLITTNIE